MMILNDKELMNVEGGGFNFGIATAIISGITFIIGILDGLVNPQRCR